MKLKEGKNTPQLTINALDLEFIPPELLGRTNQLKELYNLESDPYSNTNYWVEGGSGYGKSTTLRFFANYINRENRGKALYISCEKSMKSSIDRVRIQARLPLAKRDISASGFAEAVIKAFPDQKYYFIIDEPDKVYAKRDIGGFIHCLWNTLIECSCKFSFIFISKFSVTRMMSKVFPSDADDLYSRLQPKSIIFPVYDVPEIVAILKQRLDIMAQAQVNSNIKYELQGLTQIGSHIRRIGGDMRQALEITRESVRLANVANNGNIITNEIAEKAIEWGKNQWWERRYKSIPPHWAFIVYVAANYCYQKGYTVLEEPLLTKLYRLTCEQLSAISKQRIDPVGDSTIYWMIKQVSGANPNVDPFFQQRLARYGLPAEIVFDPSDRDRLAKVGATLKWSDYLTSNTPH